jgi:hypothetical protein
MIKTKKRGIFNFFKNTDNKENNDEINDEIKKIGEELLRIATYSLEELNEYQEWKKKDVTNSWIGGVSNDEGICKGELYIPNSEYGSDLRKANKILTIRYDPKKIDKEIYLSINTNEHYWPVSELEKIKRNFIPQCIRSINKEQFNFD